MTPDDHHFLTRTGRGTPMGDFLRRYWTAALLSRELPEADGAPLRVRLLGEDLIAFRDSDGMVGLLGEHCAHRGASLYFGKNGESGLRCLYHGWKYDRDGNCIDMPNEPPHSRFCEKVKQTAYPCVERNGVVWAYLGPRDAMPPLPELEWLTVPESHVYVSKCLRECHWTQGMEGDIDSVHVGFLHQGVFAKRAEALNHRSAQWLVTNQTPVEEIEEIPGRVSSRDASRCRCDERLLEDQPVVLPVVHDHSGLCRRGAAGWSCLGAGRRRQGLGVCLLMAPAAAADGARA